MSNGNTMSNEALTKTHSDYPVLSQGLDEMMLAIDANLQGEAIRPSDLDRIRVPGGGSTTWQIESGLGDEEEAKTIEGVIVHHSLQRAFWATSFEASGGGSQPDCYSVDSITGVGNPGGSCHDCPQAQFGSDGDGQACKQTRVLFILRPEEQLPCVLIVPPSGLANLKRYLLALSKKGRPVHTAVTKLDLVKDKSASGIAFARVKPSLGRFLEKDEAERMAAYAAQMRPYLSRVRVDEVDQAPEAPPADEAYF